MFLRYLLRMGDGKNENFRLARRQQSESFNLSPAHQTL